MRYKIVILSLLLTFCFLTSLQARPKHYVFQNTESTPNIEGRIAEDRYGNASIIDNKGKKTGSSHRNRYSITYHDAQQNQVEKACTDRYGNIHLFDSKGRKKGTLYKGRYDDEEEEDEYESIRARRKQNLSSCEEKEEGKEGDKK
ncbi:MAG: hypothetical protein MJZ28_11275 [Paludibacteraceae bacterium]|nr:hypothetical protein [Paludibacteraceae bacterium]